MAITAKELIECIQGMELLQRQEIANALGIVTCDENPPGHGMAEMPAYDPMRAIVASLTPERLAEIRQRSIPSV